MLISSILITLCVFSVNDLTHFVLLPFPRSFSLAKSQQYDQEGLIDIFTQYGDHLYSKGDHDGAIDQYIKTIGKLEASYVIRKVYIMLIMRQTEGLLCHFQGKNPICNVANWSAPMSFIRLKSLPVFSMRVFSFTS